MAHIEYKVFGNGYMIYLVNGETEDHICTCFDVKEKAQEMAEKHGKDGTPLEVKEVPGFTVRRRR